MIFMSLKMGTGLFNFKRRDLTPEGGKGGLSGLF